MSNVIQLDTKPPAPTYPVGTTFQLTRNAWSKEVITATVETARWNPTFGYVHTVAIAGKYPHWRVIFEYQIVKQAIKPAALVA